MTSAPSSCCAQVQCENRLLRRALRKERERRQFIGEAYKELLRSYERLLDLKNIIDLPSPSLSLTSSVDDTQHEQSSSNNQTKSNRNGIIQQVINNKPNQQLPPSIATTGASRSRQLPFTTSPSRIQIQSFIAEYRAAEQKRQQNGGTWSNEEGSKQTTSFFDQNIGAQTQKRHQSSTSTISSHAMSPMRKLSSSTYVIEKTASPARTYVVEETPPSPARNVAAVEPAALVDPQHQRVIDFESDDPSHQQVPVQQSPILVPSTPPLMLHRSPLQAPLPPPWDPSRTHSVPKAKTASAMASRRTGTVRTLLVDNNNNNKATTTPTNGGTNGGNSNTTVAKAMGGHHHIITGMGVGVGSPHRFRAPLGDSTAAVNNRNGQPKLTSKPERVIAIDDDDEDEDKDHDAVDSPDDDLRNVEQIGGGNGEAKALEVMRNFAPLQAPDQQRQQQSANWYFVPLFDENAGGNSGIASMRRRSMTLPNLTTLDQQHRLSILVARSQARCQAIAKASRRRTILAARRRAVVADLVQGVRPLDATAMAIIHMDTSRISAFPALMQQMRDNSRRLFFKTSPIHRRLEQEQQRKLDQATNRIMAHSSAVITKMMAKSRLSRGFE